MDRLPGRPPSVGTPGGELRAPCSGTSSRPVLRLLLPPTPAPPLWGPHGPRRACEGHTAALPGVGASVPGSCYCARNFSFAVPPLSALTRQV